jgi:hypothetical protein
MPFISQRLVIKCFWVDHAILCPKSVCMTLATNDLCQKNTKLILIVFQPNGSAGLR